MQEIAPVAAKLVDNVHGHDDSEVSHSASKWLQAPLQQREGCIGAYRGCIAMDGLVILAIAYKNTGNGGGEAVPIVDRIDAFAYLVDFLATVPVQDSRGMKAIQRLQPPKASLEGVATPVREFCLKEGVAAGKPTFTKMLDKGFYKDCRMVEGRNGAGHAPSKFRRKCLHPDGGGTGPASDVSVDSRLVNEDRSDDDQRG